MFTIIRINKMCHLIGRRYVSGYSAKTILSEENMKKTASKFANMPPLRMQAQAPFKKAAVLIPLCVIDDKVSLLYTLRASHLKSHRGQVSFPGGMFDDRDDSLEHTALRETKEELGLEVENVHIWGSGKLIVTPGEICVMPVIGQVKQNLSLTSLLVNHSEVEEVFAVALEDLCNPKKLAYTQFRRGYSTPVFLGGRKRIWGLTAAITNIFLKSLLPSTAYSHNVKYVSSISAGSFF